jgi:1-acyl-sn-glycerol-3-phosphate acyltransferase
MTIRLTALFRAARLLCHLTYGTLLAMIYPLFRLPARQTILKRWSAELLGILHVRLEITGLPASSGGQQGSLLVANHISWLDVLAINAVRPSCFIAKSEVSGWPLIGMLGRRTRTIFIERDIRRDTVRINRQTGGMLDEGECVVLFPEGTSTDGTQLRHFHSSLFQSALDCKAAIQPVAIRYHDGTGRHCNDAVFIGDMNFFQSLQNVLSSPSLHVTVVLLAPLDCAGKNRRILAAEAQAAVGATLEEQHMASNRPAATGASPIPPRTVFQSAYSLLLDPIFKFRKRHSG